MQWPLVLAGLLTGIAASPHCATMCGASCASLTGGCKRSAAGFHAGRLISYMVGGALAAGSVGLLNVWTAHAPALRPVWVLVHLGFLGLGLWWMVTGRQVSALKRGSATMPIVFHDSRARPWRAGLAGLAWIAWPCAALQTGLLLAALGSTPQAGALVMGAFALGSMPALGLAPWVWARWSARPQSASAGSMAAMGLRVAGAGLVLNSGWILARGVSPMFDAWCRAV